MQIDFNDRTNELSKEDIDKLERLLIFASEQEALPSDAELSVSIVRNDEIKELNKVYREKNEPTDVLSFAMQEMLEGTVKLENSDMPVMLGDIVISIDRAKEQAEEYGHSFERELSFLAVHGFLHLLGYDHINKKEEEEMFAKQNQLLTKYGLER